MTDCLFITQLILMYNAKISNIFRTFSFKPRDVCLNEINILTLINKLLIKLLNYGYTKFSFTFVYNYSKQLQMTQKESIRLFEERKVRAIWDDEQEEWYFSIVDVISILTDSPNPRKYWSVLKTRLKREGSELTTNCSQLKMQAADGKKYLTDVANTEQLFRLIQSVPSPKAEPF